MKRILIGCEESQTVCKAFRERGFEAFSCDLVLPSGGNWEWHIQGDLLDVAMSEKWDAMIAHPPCTFMSCCGARWMYQKGKINENRLASAMKAKDFFMQCYNMPIPNIALENPLPLKVIGLPPASQTIQPYEFGDPFSKKTLLWLKGFPMLKHTNVLSEWKPYLQSGNKHNEHSNKVRGRIRSKTFPGIAAAMAEQWGDYLNQQP